MQAQSKGAVLSLVFLWVLVVAIGYAHAGQSTVLSTGTFSGSFVSTESDTNGDGIKGGVFTGAGEASVGGKFTTQSVTEHFASGETTCPNGNPGFIGSKCSETVAASQWRAVYDERVRRGGIPGWNPR